MGNSIPAQEFGFMLCADKAGNLGRGPIGVGTATGVQFADTCPPRYPIIVGSAHSHPKEGGGSILPSAQDMREAKRLKMPNLCIINNVKSQCYGVRGVK